MTGSITVDKNKALRIEQDDAAAAVEQAVSLAKRRVTELDGGEIDDVAGGAMSPLTVVMGYFPIEIEPNL